MSRRNSPPAGPTSSSCWPRSSRAKRKRISTRATPSISAERWPCSKRSGASTFLSGGAYRPRLVFTSSIAVFGAPFPELIGDEFAPAPLTSYGTQKAICELLLADYSRRGFFDGDRPSAADHLRAARRAEQGGFGLLLRHHPRAARRKGSDPAGRRRGAPLARLASLGGRVSCCAPRSSTCRCWGAAGR